MVRGVRFAVFGSTFDECYCYCVGECAISERHIKIKGQNTTTQYFVFRGGGVTEGKGAAPHRCPLPSHCEGKRKKECEKCTEQEQQRQPLLITR